MTAQTMQIGNRPCRIYGEAHAEYLLLQMTGEHELQSIDHEVAAIAQSSRNFLFAAIPVESWNDALSPWEAPAVWGKQGFGGNAEDTLRFLTEQVIPTLKQLLHSAMCVKQSCLLSRDLYVFLVELDAGHLRKNSFLFVFLQVHRI